MLVGAREYWVSRPRTTSQPLRENGKYWSDNEVSRWVVYRDELIEWANRVYDRSYKVLDFGCGPGYLSIFCRDYYGVDTDESCLAYAVDHGITVRSVLPDYTVDVAVLYHVLEHCDNPASELTAVLKCVRSGGTVIIGMPDFGCPTAQRFGPRYRMLNDSTHISLFTLESAHRFVRAHGLQIDEVTFPCPEPLDSVAWIAGDDVSPEWPGNWFTLWCTKP